MRQKRSKTYRKLLSSYILHFNFRPPFQVLIDAPFTRSLAALHLTPHEVDRRLSDVLQTSQLSKGKTRAGNPEMKCLITQCSMVKLYQAEKEGTIEKDAVTIAKSWERRRCNHREAIDADQCLKEVIGPNNKHRYLVASDSKALRHHLREQVAGLPLVHTNQSRVIVLEPMSDKTKERVQELEHDKLAGQGGSIQTPQYPDDSLGSNIVTQASMSTSVLGQIDPTLSKKRKVRGEANPLSNKKPKKVLEAEQAEKERRTREIAERTEMKRKKAQQEQERESKRVEISAIQEPKDKAEYLKASREEDADHSSVERAASVEQRGTTGASEEGKGEGVEGRKKRKRGGRGAGGKATSKQQGVAGAMSPEA